MQATPSHMLVPIDTLTSSPTSSTGSASILDWNSNSDGELLQLSSPGTLTATPSPPPGTLSPSIVFSLPLADDSRLETPSDLEDPFLEQWEMTAPFFNEEAGAAPIIRRGDSGAVADDDNTAPVDSEAVKPINSILPQPWEQLFRIRTALESLSFSSSDGNHSPRFVDDDGESAPTPSYTNPDSSIASTIIMPHLPDSLGSASMATTTKTRNGGVIETPSIPHSPVIEVAHPTVPNHNISSAMSSDPSTTTPAVALSTEEVEPEAISIGEYLQRKALSADDLAIRAPSPGVEPSTRPSSTNSGLSYFSQPISPVIQSVHASTVEVNQGNDQNHSNHADAEEVAQSSPRTTERAATPTEHSILSWKPAQVSPISERGQMPYHCVNNLLCRLTREENAPMVHSNRPPVWPPSPPLLYPNSPNDDLPAKLSPRNSPTEGSAPASVSSSPASTRRAPILPSVNYAIRSAPIPRVSKPSISRGSRFSLSPEFPRHTMPDFEILSVQSEQNPMRSQSEMSDIISSFRNSVNISAPHEEHGSPVGVSRPLPRSAFSASPESFHQELEVPQSPVSSIPQWLADSSRSSHFRASETTPATNHVPRSRPPLPPVPVSKVETEPTPQFALRSDLARSPQTQHEYFAEAMPSGWGVRILPTPPPPPFSPQITVDEAVWHSPATSADTPISPPPPALPSVTSYMPSGTNDWQWPSTNPPLNNPAPPPRPPPVFCSPTWQRTPFQGGQGSSAQYTGSTLPRDRKLPAPASPNWELPPRRLRFAPLPTPSQGAGRVGLGIGPTPVAVSFGTLPSSNFYSNPSYIYHGPYAHSPVIPQLYPNPPLPNVNPQPAIPLNVFSNNTYPSSKKYWFSDATVVFRVEDCLYRVHRHFFDRHSDTLSRMLATYWFDPTNHVFLPDVKKIEFERLLSIFYPTDLTKPDITTVSGWTSILALGQKWQMIQIKALAIQKLGPLTTAVEKIAIAKKYSFGSNHEWLLPAYTELCSRRSPLTLEEAEELDLPTVIKVWEVQNSILNLTYRGICNDTRISDLVKEKFGFTSYSFWEFGPDGTHM
ncbi:hypothetical protein JR316_0002612 [Psilocybe cubensis]|uniref:BTB domain-containing protein n=2 Tax=Psilocybe cubensis TaxID=181762 RepID=A0A8H8CPQ8_PSICU|nr:hypothetical protein JR316_0002612 [Psilocybe cubensis]KAH9485700.1 hypothetical protein JR316_0002612 [Psilocybe cubensis]